MMRLLNICVIVALVLAAADVYKIKFESTRQAQRVAKLRMEIRREHDAIAALRARMGEARQPGAHPGSGAAASRAEAGRKHGNIDRLDNLPERPPDLVPPDEPDPIGTMIAQPELIDRSPTGSIPAAKR